MPINSPALHSQQSAAREVLAKATPTSVGYFSFPAKAYMSRGRGQG
jgi:hypothetical protein